MPHGLWWYFALIVQGKDHRHEEEPCGDSSWDCRMGEGCLVKPGTGEGILAEASLNMEIEGWGRGKNMPGGRERHVGGPEGGGQAWNRLLRASE